MSRRRSPAGEVWRALGRCFARRLAPLVMGSIAVLPAFACAGGEPRRADRSDGPSAEVEVYAPDSLLVSFPADGARPFLERGFALEVHGRDVYVLDQSAGTVLRFDLEGAFLNSIGRPGQGPGELGSPGELRLGSDGSVWITALHPPKIARFQPDGQLVAEYRPPFPAVNFAPLGADRLLIPALFRDGLLSSLRAPADTTVLPVDTEIPRPLAADPLLRLSFKEFLLVATGPHRLALLRNHEGRDFDLWTVQLSEAGSRISSITRVPLPEWLYDLLDTETAKLKKSVSKSFASGGTFFPFRSLHAAGGGALWTAPSPSDRILALRIDPAGGSGLRVVVPSGRQEYRGMVDAVVAGNRLVALEETRVRVYSLRRVADAKLRR
ncbi:MAG: 6-bladed beta-propeller [Gemmatimonadota bacterium]